MANTTTLRSDIADLAAAHGWRQRTESQFSYWSESFRRDGSVVLVRWLPNGKLTALSHWNGPTASSEQITVGKVAALRALLAA